MVQRYRFCRLLDWANPVQHVERHANDQTESDCMCGTRVYLLHRRRIAPDHPPPKTHDVEFIHTPEMPHVDIGGPTKPTAQLPVQIDPTAAPAQAAGQLVVADSRRGSPGHVAGAVNVTATPKKQQSRYDVRGYADWKIVALLQAGSGCPAYNLETIIPCTCQTFVLVLHLAHMPHTS